MIDAQWVPDNNSDVYQDENTNEKVYSEVTSGCWYKRTYNKLMLRHIKNTAYPALLVVLVLGQDGTLCDKIGRLTSEPILVSVSNVLYKKSTHHNAWFCLGFIPEYPKTQLESKKTKKSTNELSNKYYHKCLKFIMNELYYKHTQNIVWK